MRTAVDASDLIRRAQSRTAYAGKIIKEQAFDRREIISLNNPQTGVYDSGKIPVILEGIVETSVGERNAILGIVQEAATINPAPAPDPPTPSEDGSLAFSGTTSSYLQVDTSTDFNLTSASFTIEWFQYIQSGGGGSLRVFSIGSYFDNNIRIAVSYETPSNTSFYLWTPTNFANLVGTISPYNAWQHIAIVGTGGNTLKVYVNGTQLGSTVSRSYTYTQGGLKLTLGNETGPSAVAALKGKITNFRWVNGTAVYTGNFTPPTAPLTAISGTVLLLLADSTEPFVDSSGTGKTITNTGVTADSGTPF